jgi:polar amino acid transport system substrate-binding protein
MSGESTGDTAAVHGAYSRFCNYWVHILVMIVLIVAPCNPVARAEGGAAPAVPRFVAPAVQAQDVPRPMSIRFVTSDDFPPFQFLDGAGRLTGYNVELARAICAKLQIPCTVQVRRFSLLVDAVASNEADAIVAGLRDTPGLRRFVAHTLPYLRLPARFVARRDRPVTGVPETMAGVTVAVVGGTRYADFLRDFFPGTTLLEIPTLEDGLAALRERKADAVFGGGLPLVFWLNAPDGAGCCAFAGGAFTEPAYFGDGLTIAVRREDEPLRRALDEALRDLEVDGVLADLYLRFFPAGLY